MSRASMHHVGEKIKALCFIKDVRSSEAHEQFELLPLVAAGGWDSETNYVSLHLPILPTRDENELRREFGQLPEARACELSQVAEAPHHGDVNALQFVATKGENLLFTASSSGSVLCFRVSDTSTTGASTMSDDAEAAPVVADSPLSVVAIPQWENVFRGASVTCLDASESKATLVAASETGGVAWLRFDDAMGVSKIGNKGSSKLAINGVRVLGRDSVAATVGSVPGSQLRVWDVASNQTFPVLSASDPHASAILTSIETHPTRPELLITGADDGRVCLWDQRRLDTPFRTETKHQRAVRALKLHSAAPRFLYSGGDDATVLAWNFHHGGRSRDSVEYDHLASAARPGSSVSSTAEQPAALQVDVVADDFLPWNAVDVHAESDTLVAGSDAQSILLLQHVSKLQRQFL